MYINKFLIWFLQIFVSPPLRTKNFGYGPDQLYYHCIFSVLFFCHRICDHYFGFRMRLSPLRSTKSEAS